ncbi:MAG TPA: putative toxin-antitoxin system toxin component, PIN family [Longimicrobiaceae bacterium]|nr:putative toxin-antitoxin system toxin component, PIN family [Longimicrobiaceae bacterium]
MKIFLDTNVLVSAHATRGLCADVLRVVLAEHELITAEVVLEELERILTSKIRLPQDVVAEILISLREHPVEPRPESSAAFPVRDPDDAWVLASALAAGAEVLVSGDPDLLEVAEEIPGIRITSPRGLWSMLRGA